MVAAVIGPASPSGMDVDRPHPDERGTLLLVSGAALIAVLAAVVWWWSGRPQPVSPESVDGQRTAPLVASAPPPPAASSDPLGAPGAGGSSPPASAGSTADQEVTVDVRGGVRSPGVLRLPGGSRVEDAVEAAGGLKPGSRYGSVNLARPLSDGEQIVVGRARPAAPPPAQAEASPGVSGAAPLDLNTASAEQLETLDGIGPVLAADIVRWRSENGRFASVDDLLDVSGIGEATLAGLRDQVTVG